VVSVKDIRMVDPVAVGDFVSFVDAGDGTGMIARVEPRRSKFSRRASGPKPIEQVIVANVDQIVPVFAAAQPALKWNMLDRYLVDAESVEIPAIICITKMDLAEDGFERDLRTYGQIGYEVVRTSAVTGEGISRIKDVLANKTTVLVGKSGVGKTTLLNAIQPDLGLRVNEVSQKTGKGKHTTTQLEMFELEFGGYVVDTPGMREFGLHKLSGPEMASLFREMRPHLGLCRFGAGCTHTHEPGCAIKQAVEAGSISSRRYESYVRLMR